MATLSNGQLAVRVNDLVSFVQSRHGQLDQWMNGVVGGGDFNNGTYPLTDNLGETIYVRCPAQLESEVDGNVSSAATHLAAAQAAAVQAAADAVATTLDATSSTTSRADALAAQDLAENARDAAVNAQVNAIAQKQAAKLYSERAFELVDNLGALGSYSVDYGYITDLIITIFTNGADFGLISAAIDEFADLGQIATPHNQVQNLGYL